MKTSDKERFKECIMLNDDESKIEEIIIDSMEVNSFDDIFIRLMEMGEFEKEYKVNCTLKKIVISPKKWKLTLVNFYWYTKWKM